VLSGCASWDDPGAALDEHGAFLRRFTAEHDVQTNEVQRSWALLPAFLAVADGRPLDLLELGPSAGLNLVWDRYRYAYSSGCWGDPDAPLALTGDDRVAPPAELVARPAEVARRRGVDLNPVDATSDEGSRLLRAFVWPDQHERLERLERAITVLRSDPPVLLRGDYVEQLPALLDDRCEDAQLVVFETASAQYLDREQLHTVRAAMQAAGRAEPFVYLTARSSSGSAGYSLEAERWPGGERQRLAVFDFHAAWLEWADARG